MTYIPPGITYLEIQQIADQRDAAVARVAELEAQTAALVAELAAKDPELMEALARRQGYARKGETVYTFRNRER